jgi:hypothetical protein
MKTKLSALTLALLPIMSVSSVQASDIELFDDSVIVVYKANVSQFAKIRAR